jgi:hypothetical protein
MVVLLGCQAFAFTGEELNARVEETRELRAMSGMAADAPSIPASMYAEAASGKVQTTLVSVPGVKAKKAVGVGVVDVPIERFWSAVNDDASKPLYTKLSFTEVLEGGLCGDRRLVFMFLPVPMLTDRYWVVEAKKNLALQSASSGRVREMTWDSRKADVPHGKRARDFMHEGMEIEFAKGAWWLTALDDGHTLVEYWTWTDPGGYVPAGLASSMAAGGIKDTFEKMTELATKGARCPVE